MYVNKFDHDRSLMIEEQLIARGIKDAAVLRAMSVVAREKLLPKNLIDQSYFDQPLPIGKGQTISQPYIVALMSQALRFKPEDKVLEVGTGCGYQTAIAAEIVSAVYSLEIIPELYRQAKKNLVKTLGYTNVHLREGSGRKGWAEEAPFNKIVVAAVSDKIPPALLQQLANGGKLVMPLKLPSGQKLVVVKKDEQGVVTQENLLDVVFVPLK